MAVNRELVQRKISLILQDLERLEELAQQDLSEYLADYKNEVLAERFLEKIIGRIIDINYHVIAEHTLSAPADYHSSFTRLGTLNILDAEKAAEFARLAGLRNRLAHEYNDIDEKIVHQAVREIVAQVPSYIEAINGFLSETGSR